MNTVFFDLGNVLIFFSIERMLKQLASCLSISVHVLQDYLQKERIAEQYEIGKLTSEELFKLLQQISCKPCSIQQLSHALSDIFIPNLQLWPIVEQLHLKGTRLILLSNTNECHFQFAYASFPVLKLFDEFILSYQVGACKPHTQIFERALQEAKGKTFYTDDIPAFVEAGRSAGLDAEVFLDVPTLQNQLIQRGFLAKI